MNPESIIKVERSLLGSLLFNLDERHLIICRKIGLTPDSFLDPALAIVYREICDGARNGFLPDNATLSAKLDAAVMQKLGGAVAMDRLIDEACIGAHVEYHAKQVYRAALSRHAASTCQGWAAKIAQSQEPEIALAQIVSDIQALQNRGLLKSEARHVADFREEKVEQWRLARGKGYVGIPSSLKEINRYLGGYRPGVMTVLGAYRGCGKSTLARQEALQLARQGYKVLLCTMEDPGDIAAAGMAGNYANKSVFHLDTGADPDGIERIDASWAELRNLPLHIAAGALRIEDIETTAQIHKSRHGLDFIIIDHIQYITPYIMPRLDRNGTVGTYSQRIAGMLKAHNIPGLVLSQLSRDSEKESRRPRLSDLRDSGCIEQDARAVLLMWWDGDMQSHVIEIAKNNFGVANRKFKLRRVDGRQRFEMIDEIDAPAPVAPIASEVEL